MAMPIHSRASIRYARALLMAAEQTGELQALKDEVHSLRELVSQTPDLRAFLADPTIAKRRKLGTLERLLKAHVSPLTWRFLQLLTEKYRERMLPEVLDAAVTLIDEREGRVHADVVSATPLQPEQQTRLQQKLHDLTGKDVTVHAREDASIVSGFVARVGDTVFDASLAAQLRRLRRSLVAADMRAKTGLTGGERKSGERQFGERQSGERQFGERQSEG